MNIIRKKMEAKGTPLAEPAGCLQETVHIVEHHVHQQKQHRPLLSLTLQKEG